MCLNNPPGIDTNKCNKEGVQANKCAPNNWECGLATDVCGNIWSCGPDKEGECNTDGKICDRHVCKSDNDPFSDKEDPATN